MSPIALVQGNPSPRAIFVCDRGPSLWLGAYNFDSATIENQREFEAPGRDEMFQASYFFDRPDFATAKDLDGDGVDDIVGFWKASAGATDTWPKARVVVWSSRTLEALRVEELFGGPEAPPFVRLRPVHGSMETAVSSFLVIASAPGGGSANPGLADFKSAIYSYDLATGRQASLIAGIEYLAVAAPILRSGGDLLCGVATVSNSNASESLMSVDLKAGCAPWKVSSSNYSTGEVDFVEPAPDVDLRGVTDLFVIIDDKESGCRLFCVAGEDGAMLWSVPAAASLPSAHRLGDVDGDGAPDMVFVQPDDARSQKHTSVVVRSGMTGEVLWDVRDMHFGHEPDRRVASRVDSQGGWCLLGSGRVSMSLLRITAQK